MISRKNENFMRNKGLSNYLKTFYFYFSTDIIGKRKFYGNFAITFQDDFKKGP